MSISRNLAPRLSTCSLTAGRTSKADTTAPSLLDRGRLDLQDHVALLEDIPDGCRRRRPGGAEGVVTERGGLTGATLHNHDQTGLHKPSRDLRCQRHTALAGCGLLGDPKLHPALGCNDR